MVNNITCPKCGAEIPVTTTPTNRTGRKPLAIPVENVYNALRSSSTIGQAAEKLGCSRAHIYMALLEQGTTPKEVMEAKAKREKNPA